MPGRMISLSNKKDFDQVFKNGRSCFDKIIGVKVLPNKLKQHRLGVIISSKVSKKAVERNLLKRRLKEIVKKELVGFLDDYDMVLIALPGACKKNFVELSQSINYLFNRMRIRAKK